MYYASDVTACHFQVSKQVSSKQDRYLNTPACNQDPASISTSYFHPGLYPEPGVYMRSGFYPRLYGMHQIHRVTAPKAGNTMTDVKNTPHWFCKFRHHVPV